MNLQERDYWLAFNVVGGIGPKRFGQILKHFGSATKAWKADNDNWLKTSLPLTLIDHLIYFKKQFDLLSYKLRLEKYLITFLTLEDNQYPNILKEIDFPPFIIYIKGQLLLQDNLAISVVGTRKISSYGRQVTTKVVQSLVSHNVTIVSGLARGVDSVAHYQALQFGGRTLAVVGHGLDLIYPPENKLLSQEIIKNGALVSQFPLNIQSVPGNFSARNKTIAGLSLATVVTEGAADSGSLITAGFARSFGRPVFAVPGPITSGLSAGPIKLLKEGAKVVTSGEDILEELKIKNPASKKGTHLEGKNKNSKFEDLKFNNQTEEKIWQTLVNGIKHIDQITRESGLTAPQVASALTTMELSGLVKNLGSGEYCL